MDLQPRVQCQLYAAGDSPYRGGCCAAHQGGPPDLRPPVCQGLNDTGISEFERICSENGCFFQRPRISKLKSFLESAITKFHIQDTGEYNILCINWSYTDIVVNGYIEPTMLLFNKVNGIMNHKDMAGKLGISSDIYKKISAVLVFQNSVEAI